jgi:hypothetical protein
MHLGLFVLPDVLVRHGVAPGEDRRTTSSTPQRRSLQKCGARWSPVDRATAVVPYWSRPLAGMQAATPHSIHHARDSNWPVR